eukprot:7634959-Pyramimonas_sp.AAC.1
MAEWRCRQCGVRAATSTHLSYLCWGTRKHCNPTPLQAVQMDLFFGTTRGLGYQPVRSEATSAAVIGADLDAGVDEPEQVVDSTGTPQLATHGIFQQQGHAIPWDGLACICA